MAGSKTLFHLEIDSALWRNRRGVQARLRAAAEATLDHLPVALRALAARATWTVLLTTDSAVHRLNCDFRGMDKPTNVLSFPQFDAAMVARPQQILRMFPGAGDKIDMGDIAISSRYVVREAKAEGKDVLDHVAHLSIHGLLHLFGYDHMTEAEANRMEKLEQRIMESMGLPDPYAPVMVEEGA